MQSKSQVEAARKAAESSKAAFDAGQTKMQFGVSTAYRVIQFQRDFVAAQSQEIQAKVNYLKARIQMDRTIGMSLQRNNISVTDVLKGSR